MSLQCTSPLQPTTTMMLCQNAHIAAHIYSRKKLAKQCGAAKKGKCYCVLGNNPRGQDRPRTFDPSQLPCRGHCLLRQLRKRPLLPISIGRTAADSLSYNEVYCQCPFQSRPECDRNRPAQSRLSPDFGYTPTACVSEPGVSDVAHRLLPHARALAHA